MHVVLFVAFTSVILYVAGRRRGWTGGALASAAARLLECLGLAAALLALNVGTGLLVIAAMRVATGRFVSLYVAADVTLAPLSLAQAILFQWWRALADSSD